MSNKNINIQNLSWCLPHKNCFVGFNTQINYGARLGIIGRNGSGKTSLLEMIAGDLEPSFGQVFYSNHLDIAYVPQVLPSDEKLSGGKQLLAKIEAALVENPDVLLLDEPTNHLDRKHQQILFTNLQNFTGTLIIVSHDRQLLSQVVNEIWHVENEKIEIFKGNIKNYLEARRIRIKRLTNKLENLTEQEKKLHEKRMKEQKRQASSKKVGQKNIANRKWSRIAASNMRMKGEATAAKKQLQFVEEKQTIHEELSNIELPPIIKPRFSFSAPQISGQNQISIVQGSIEYKGSHQEILHNLNFQLGAGERVVVQGANGSGKTTFVKALFNDNEIIKTGNWYSIDSSKIGYLDQKYDHLDLQSTVFDNIASVVPNWNTTQIRELLSDFLFRTTTEVDNLTQNLSGGEKARLSLAKIAAHTPTLLILDEITNNLDMETKDYVLQVLQSYPGTLLIISHDADFITQLNIDNFYEITNRQLIRQSFTEHHC